MTGPDPKRSGLSEFGRFAARALRRRWRKYRGELKQCRHHCAESSVHNLRVAIRRLCSILEVQAELQAGPETAEVVRRLGKQLRWLGPLRDTHVQREHLQALRPRFPELKMIIRFLEKRERKLMRQARRKMSRIDPGELKELLESRDLRLTRLAGASGDRAWARSLRAVDGAFRAVRRRFERLEAARPDSIHRLRLAFKDFRYRVEALAPVLPGASRGRLERMRHFQSAMGRIQDREILVELIQSFAASSKRDQAGLRPVEQLLTRQQSAAIRAFVRSAKRVLDFWTQPETGARLRAARVRGGKKKE